MSTTTEALHWLAAGEPDPGRVHQWWQSAHFALIAVGTRWDVVKIDDARATRDLLQDGLEGPIMCDPDGSVGSPATIYILVPPGTSSVWDVAETECLGENSWLKVPSPKRTCPPGPYWLQPPAPAEALVDPAQLHAALQSLTSREGW